MTFPLSQGLFHEKNAGVQFKFHFYTWIQTRNGGVSCTFNILHSYHFNGFKMCWVRFLSVSVLELIN